MVRDPSAPHEQDTSPLHANVLSLSILALQPEIIDRRVDHANCMKPHLNEHAENVGDAGLGHGTLVIDLQRLR